MQDCLFPGVSVLQLLLCLFQEPPHVAILTIKPLHDKTVAEQAGSVQERHAAGRVLTATLTSGRDCCGLLSQGPRKKPACCIAVMQDKADLLRRNKRAEVVRT